MTTVEQPASTREHILQAAMQVFAEKGYHDTRVDDIVVALNHALNGCP